MLARELHIPATRVSQIVNGRRGISADTAMRAARYFGTTPEFWLNLQSRYDLLSSERSGGNHSKAGTSADSVTTARLIWPPLAASGVGHGILRLIAGKPHRESGPDNGIFFPTELRRSLMTPQIKIDSPGDSTTSPASRAFSAPPNLNSNRFMKRAPKLVQTQSVKI